MHFSDSHISARIRALDLSGPAANEVKNYTTGEDPVNSFLC